MFRNFDLKLWTLHVLAVMFAGGILWGFYEGKIGTDVFMTIAGSVIGYFTANQLNQKELQ